MYLLNSLAKNLILSVVGFYIRLYLSRLRYSWQMGFCLLESKLLDIFC